jgi:hypothetical protein
MAFENYLKNETFKDFELEINSLWTQWLLLEQSTKFLSKKIEEFKANWKLEDFEIDFIKEQIEYHKRLSDLKKKYLIKRLSLSEKSVIQIDKVYKEIEWTAVSESEINYLEWKTFIENEKLVDTFKDTSYRDFIEENINIINWPETAYEWESIKNFYDIFTLQYLNFIEKLYPETEILKQHSDIKKWLIISNDFVNQILYKIFDIYWDELIELNNDIVINILGKKEKFSIEAIKKQVKKEKRIKHAQQKEKDDEEKERKEKTYKLKLLDEVIKKVYNLKWTIEEIWKITPLNKDDSIEIVKEKFIKFLLLSWSLKKSKISALLITKNWFNDENFTKIYSDIIKNNWENLDVKSIDKSYAKLLLVKLLDDIEDLETIREKTTYVLNNSNNNLKKQQEDLFIDYLLETWEISKTQLLKKSEKFESFNYLEFLEKYWLNEEVEKAYMQMLTKKMKNFIVYIEWKKIKLNSKFIEKNKASILHNLEVFNKIIVWIESDW